MVAARINLEKEQTMKILLLGSQHGNELLGEMLYERIQARHSQLLPHLTYKLGNPQAHHKKVRFIESDMNRSYDGTLDTHEARRAQHILQYIKDGEYDLVLDLHTTVCNQPPCFILPEISEYTRPFIRASHIERVVLLTDPIVKTSLTGASSKAVAIEVANSQLTPELLDDLCQDIERFLKKDTRLSEKKVYHVPSLLLKSEVAPELLDSLINFEKTKDGFIPILTGNNSYRKNTHYLGFKAASETIITL